jgi:hypothetical protein
LEGLGFCTTKPFEEKEARGSCWLLKWIPFKDPEGKNGDVRGLWFARRGS